MGQAKDALLRRKIIVDRSKGISFTALAAQYGIGYNTVRSICHRYAREGELGLVPKTAACGRRRTPRLELSFRLVRLVSHLHPTWGIPFICTRIALKFPDLVLQSERHYQRRIKRRIGSLPAPVLPKAEVADRARQVHDTWQIDAKERLDFTAMPAHQGCFLNITDEKSSALLEARAFPPRADLSSATGQYSHCFDGSISKMGTTQRNQNG